MTRRAEKRQLRLRAVLSAAMQVVNERGLEGLTIVRVAERVDAAVGALYRYYPSKEALIVALQIEALDALRDDLERCARSVESATRRARLERKAAALASVAAVPLAYLSECRRMPMRHRLISDMLGAPVPVLSEQEAYTVEDAVLPVLTLAARRLQVAVERGALRRGDAGERTLLLWAGVHGLTLFSHRDRISPPERRVAALAPSLVGALLRGWGGAEKPVKTGVALAVQTLRLR